MARTPQVSVYYLRWLQDYLLQQGQAVHWETGQRSHVPMAEWRQKLDMAATLLADSNLGLHLAQTVTPARFGVMGYLLHHCETLLHVALRLQRYLPLFFSLQQIEVTQTADGLLARWQVDRLKPHYHEEVFAVASLVQFASTLCGTQLRPLAVGLVSPAPQDTHELADYLGCALFFGQDSNWIRADAALLYQPTAQPDASLRAVLEQQADLLLASLPDSNDDELIARLRRSIVACLQGGEPTLPQVAASMHVSSRTLHRRLAGQGSSFRAILEQTRFELAKSYLTDARLTLADVAILLGYAEQSPFTHAFKRWSGMTPGQWRRVAN